jgi:hypothetical protein
LKKSRSEIKNLEGVRGEQEDKLVLLKEQLDRKSMEYAQFFCQTDNTKAVASKLKEKLITSKIT